MATINLPPVQLLVKQLLENGFPEPLWGANEYHFVREKIRDGPNLRKRIAAAGLKDWRFDLAWPEQKIAVEVDGGQFMLGGGRHGGAGDYEKINIAQAWGWRVYRFTNRMVENGHAIKFMKEHS